MNILVSFGVVVSAFTISTITSFFICYANGYPFMNPTFSNEKRMTRINDKINKKTILQIIYNDFFQICNIIFLYIME